MKAVIAILLGCRIASADPTADAAAHYRQGKAFIEARQYDQAVAEYTAAYAIDKLPSHLFNIARAYHLKGGKLGFEAALDFYKQYLAAEPQTARGSEVRGYIADVTRQLGELEAKRKAAEDTARRAAEKQRLDADAHLKQAEAYVKASSWIGAGDEYRAAADGGDPTKLLAAAEAYLKHPDRKKAREAYLGYLDREPTGATSDAVRAKVAALTTAIDKEDAELARQRERERLSKEQRDREDRLRATEPAPIFTRKRVGYIAFGASALAVAGGVRFGLQALDQKSIADNECTENGSCRDNGLASGEANGLARNADILFGIGLGLAVTGVVLVVTAPSSKRSTTSLRIVPTGGGAAVLGRF
jgi:hypothetical protein